MYESDRRMFDRFAVDFSSEIRQPGSQRCMSAECRDVSAAGAGLLTKEKLIPDTTLEVTLGIPNGHQPFHGLARVVWTKQVQENQWRSGLKFETVDFMGMGRILATLAQGAK